MSAATLEVRSLGMSFGDREALRDISFDVRPGEMLAVIGPNGAGKTTLLSILGGILPAGTGTVSGSLKTGWVPQRAALYSKLSVAENLRLFARLERLEDPEGAVERMLDLAALRDRAGEELGNLSGGNRQRVNLAIGLLADPPALLLDEPTAALDPRQRERLWSFIGTHAQGGTSVIFATHDIAEAERHAERVLVLADGELLFSGTPRELKAEGGAGEGDLEQAFVAFLRARGH